MPRSPPTVFPSGGCHATLPVRTVGRAESGRPAHAGRWDEVKELVKTEPDVTQRDLFHLISVMATEGSAAGVRELGAFDNNARQTYGSGVAEGTRPAPKRVNYEGES